MRSAIRPLVVALLTAGVAASVTGRSAYAQADKRVSVYDFRPLAEAHAALVMQARSLVTYEDAYHENPGQFAFGLQARPSPNRREGRQVWELRPVWSAPPRTLVFDYPAADLANPDVLFANLISQYHKSLSDDEYRLLREAEWLHVLPKASRNAKGELIERASRLDVRVTFPEAERTVESAIQVLIDTVNKTPSPATFILFGGGADSLLARTKVRAGARNEIARHVLMRVLEATGQKVTWSLLCTFHATPDRRPDISDGACGLNFRALEYEVPIRGPAPQARLDRQRQPPGTDSAKPACTDRGHLAPTRYTPPE